MTMTNSPNTDVELHSLRLNRRAVIMTAAVAAGAAAGVSPVLAQATPSASFGAPLVELQVPPGVLTLEQKAAMIKGITEVVLNAMKLTPGPTQVSFVQVIETAQGGFGVNGQVFVPRPK
jgi:4-oxalocrotonate tautomerase